MIHLKPDFVSALDLDQSDTVAGEISPGGVVAHLALLGRVSPLPTPLGRSAPSRPGMTVDSIRVGETDARGVRVRAIYAIKRGVYAIYRADDQMMVHFADDPARADEQRCRIAALAGIRAKLTMLISPMDDRQYYDGQIAHGFQLALDGSPEQAEAVMTAAVANAQKERACAGRLQYLFYGMATGVFFLALFSMGYLFLPFATLSSDIWLAVIGGTFGAIFSIAISIRSRTIALDLYREANITDGVLRILVGIIGAAALVLLLSTGVVPELKVNGGVISGDGAVWQTVVVVGFVAGFLERLLPNLLEPA